MHFNCDTKAPNLHHLKLFFSSYFLKLIRNIVTQCLIYDPVKKTRCYSDACCDCILLILLCVVARSWAAYYSLTKQLVS